MILELGLRNSTETVLGMYSLGSSYIQAMKHDRMTTSINEFFGSMLELLLLTPERGNHSTVTCQTFSIKDKRMCSENQSHAQTTTQK